MLVLLLSVDRCDDNAQLLHNVERFPVDVARRVEPDCHECVGRRVHVLHLRQSARVRLRELRRPETADAQRRLSSRRESRHPGTFATPPRHYAYFSIPTPICLSISIYLYQSVCLSYLSIYLHFLLYLLLGSFFSCSRSLNKLERRLAFQILDFFVWSSTRCLSVLPASPGYRSISAAVALVSFPSVCDLLDSVFRVVFLGSSLLLFVPRRDRLFHVSPFFFNL